MQVLGDLIELPKDGLSLPLPWWQRAPLGFLHETNVYIGFVTSARPVGDLVVSALDINKWDNMLRLDCTHDDEEGVIANLMEAVLPLNVALAETVTTETGKDHHATLICEDKGTQKVKDAIPRIKEILTKRGFRQINIDPFLSPVRLPIVKSCQAVIDHGWLRGIPFQEWIREYHKEAQRKVIDLSRAVVSADTENRILRYVFPIKGARTIKIAHSDRPGALRNIFRQFAESKLNVLSALLRRGGQKSGYAELLAVCEPKANANQIQVYEELHNRIKSIDQQFDARFDIREGRRAEDVIYPPGTHERSLRRKQSVFFAARFKALSERGRKIADEVRRVLKDFDCYSLELIDGPKNGGFSETALLIERAHAGLLLVTEYEGCNGSIGDGDLFHELGFLQGLRKPTLLLVQKSSSEMYKHLIIGRQTISRELAEEDQAFDRDHPFSVECVVGAWLRGIRENG